MFNDKIKFDLSIAIGSKKFSIPGANVREFMAETTSYGFEARITFWEKPEETGDDLFKALSTQDLAEVRVTALTVLNLPDPPPDPFQLCGPVIAKTVEERVVSLVDGDPVQFRYYSLTFADAARVFWSQHYPCELLVGVSMEDVISAHLVEGISLTCEWPLLNQAPPMTTLALEPARGCSFYDFVLWYADSNNGVFRYNCKENTYYLSDDKAGGTAGSLSREIVDQVTFCQRSVPRHEVNILNVYSDDARKLSVSQAQSVDGIRHDHLVRTQVASALTDRETLEKSRLKLPQSHQELSLRDFPHIPVQPHSLVKFADDWSANAAGHGKTYRVFELAFRCSALEMQPEVDWNEQELSCSVGIDIKLEIQDDPWVCLPDYHAPAYPIHVEGTVISEEGAEKDTSYTVYTDNDTSLDNYKIHVPLWNKDITVQFESDYLPPHFYFPAYRDTRVLLALDLHRATIARFLDFGPRVRLPQDSQGNHLLFGLNEDSQTAIKHAYFNKKPMLDIERKTEDQSELIRLSDGTILIQTESAESGLSSGGGVNLTPRVDAAKADLFMQTQGAVSEATASFTGAKSQVKGEINTAMTETQGALGEMESALKGSAAQAKAAIEEASGALGEQTAKLRAGAAEARAKLEQLKGL